jgi:putative ABC transport system permease protein
VRAATPRFFETLRIPIVRGRALTVSDGATAAHVAVINRRLAHELFADSDPIGRRITCTSFKNAHPDWATVIGVNADIRADGLGDDVRDEVYFSSAQFVQRGMSLLVRGSVPVTTLAPAIRRTVAGIDPLLPVSGMRTMAAVIDDSVATPRFTSLLLSCLGLLGLVLAVIGIYGVIAYFVAQRTNEIGIRMALGADRASVVAMVVRQGVVLALLGIAVGGIASFFLGSTLNHLLYGVTARDPLTFAMVATLLAVVAILASVIPARRAARVDPLVALRSS